MSLSVSAATSARQILESGLERLPPEVRRHLLPVLDLVGLRALVRASPTYHEQYLLDRRLLLGSGLEVTLGSVGLDAYAVQKSSDRASKSPDYLRGLLGTWRGQLSQRTSWRLGGVITEDEAIHMASFYFRTIAPMVGYFIRWALDDLERQRKAFEDASDPQPEPSNT